MGGGSWDPRAYTSAATTRAARGEDDFGHDSAVRSGRAKGISSLLDPKTVAGPTSPLAGMNVRESRDSDEHPNSFPIGVLFDVTGSMREIPRTVQKKLALLMDTVISKTGLPDPQVLVGAIGDSHSDQYPFQVGQFESDNRFDETLRAIILEGNGGGQVMESYGLAYRFAADHTASDAWEKRGKKGYLFTMGDEAPWPTVTAGEVERIFGVKAGTDESVEDLIARASERWEIFHLFSMDGSYPNHTNIHDTWRKLLGERFVKVEDSSLICEVIAGIVHMLETSYDADRVVRDLGLSGAVGKKVRNALVPVSANRPPAHVARGGVPTASKRSGVTRI